MNCNQARLFITTDFLEQGNRHHTDMLQVHLLKCAACRSFRDELAHIYKAYQHRDEILPPGPFVQKLKGLYTKKKLSRGDLSTQKPMWLKGAFALGLVLFFGALFYWMQEPKINSSKIKLSKSDSQKIISQNQVTVAAEGTITKPTAKLHDEGTQKPHQKTHDEGKLSSGFASVNYNEITQKLTLDIKPELNTKDISEQIRLDKVDKMDSKIVIEMDDGKNSDVKGLASVPHDEGKILEYAQQDVSLSKPNDDEVNLDEPEELDDGGNDSDNKADLKDDEFAKDFLIKPEEIQKETKAKQDRDKAIITKLYEKIALAKKQDPPCTLTKHSEAPSGVEFDKPGYVEFFMTRDSSILLNTQGGGTISASADENFTSHEGLSGDGGTLLNYKEVYYYLNARPPQTYGRLYNARSLNRFLNQIQRSMSSNSNGAAQPLADWQNISEVLEDLDTANTNEDNLKIGIKKGMTKEASLMTEDTSHALTVMDPISEDDDKFQASNQDQYRIDYCPVDPSHFH